MICQDLFAASNYIQSNNSLFPESSTIKLPEDGSPGFKVRPQLVELSLGPNHVYLHSSCFLCDFISHLLHIFPMGQTCLSILVSFPDINRLCCFAKTIVKAASSSYSWQSHSRDNLALQPSLCRCPC